MTYWGLNAIFLAVALLVAVLALVLRRRGAIGARLVALLVTAVVLLAMTAVFDNVMIGIGLVGYDRALISGAFIGIAPLEDFAYALGAVLLLPALWVLLPARPARPVGDTASATVGNKASDTAGNTAGVTPPPEERGPRP